MAFGVNREMLASWKKKALAGEIAFLTHYWYHEGRPDVRTVTKVGCCDIERLQRWGRQYGLRPEWIHVTAGFPHFDLMGPKQREILRQERQSGQMRHFGME